ncbi:hypothetical protein DVH24_035494 [Malus domestica]|uniref:Uncharacterized protein n=1 Tax=Malus domestica TaxID=3750 RepID=A0A498J5G0_MALDO|nr:hypothetical protein DVH24_035494 [Malus domestica]
MTTRLHENISKARDQVPEMVKVEGLDSLASLKIFCWLAFKQDYHVRGYECYIATVEGTLWLFKFWHLLSLEKL